MTILNPTDVVIVDGVRTAMGKSKNGMFRNVRAETLSAELMKALIKRNDFDPNEIERDLGLCQSNTRTRLEHRSPCKPVGRHSQACGRTDRQSSVRFIHASLAHRRRPDYDPSRRDFYHWWRGAYGACCHDARRGH